MSGTLLTTPFQTTTGSAEESVLWSMHIRRAHRLMQSSDFLTAWFFGNLPEQRAISLIDVLREEGYTKSDYIQIQNGTQFVSTPDLTAQKWEMPDTHSHQPCYFVVHQNGVFLLGDRDNNQFILTENCQLVQTAMHRGFMRATDIPVPLANGKDAFSNPFLSYKWRKLHQRQLVETIKYRRNLIRLSLASPRTLTESESEKILYRNNRRLQKSKICQFQYTGTEAERKRLVLSIKMIGLIAASVYTHMLLANWTINYLYQQKDQPSPPPAQQTLPQQHPVQNQSTR